MFIDDSMKTGSQVKHYRVDIFSVQTVSCLVDAKVYETNNFGTSLKGKGENLRLV